MRALTFFLDEATRSLWRRPGPSATAVLTIALSVLVPGAFLLATVNARTIIERWRRAAEFSIYLSDEASGEQRAAVERTVAASGLVSSQRFVSPAEALDRFAAQFPELAASARSLPGNPLPASVEVRLRPDRADDPAVAALAAQVRRLPGVSDVQYDRRWIERLLGIVRAVQAAGWTLAAVLVLASCLTVMSVVRLALQARRREIEIMQLVGAPLAYIRGPFVFEGLLQGAIGAIAAIALLALVFSTVRRPLLAAAAGVLAEADLQFLPWLWTAALIAGGALVGCLGGTLAARAAR